MNYFKSLILLIFIVVANTAWGQEVDVNVPQGNASRGTADSLLQKQQYSEAIPLYINLSREFPRDASIQYSLGLCYLMGTRDIDSAIIYLTKASVADISNKVYYYLAEALRYNYRFNEAIDYYRRFTVSGGSDDIKLDEIEQKVNLCENGSYLTQYIFYPQILDTKNFLITDFYKYYSITPKNGTFISIPQSLLTSTDKKMKHNSVMFYPKKPVVGDYVYYSSYGSTTSFGKDIFRIQFMDDGYWSKPENLGDAVNSNFDEDFPYMSPDGVTLYFASKGHYGMGGYDIYKTVYNPSSKKWSTPENLGFPYNSPFDDMLYVVNESDSLSCFATNRNFLPDTVQLVLMKNEQNPVLRSYKSITELDSISKLGLVEGVGIVKTEKVESKSESPVKEVKSSSQKSASFSAVESDPEYARVIAKGFEQQRLSDSLRVKLEKLREGFDHITTADERKRLEAKVVKVEDDMLVAQKEADMMFVRASQIEQEYLTGVRKPKGKEDSTFATDNPKFIYQAQFATTVFQTDEINRLAQVEQLSSQVVKLRDSALDLKEKFETCKSEITDSASSCKTEYMAMLSAMNQYIDIVDKYFDKKYPIYSDCLPVAFVKSGTNDQSVRDVMNASTGNLRAAQAISNNLADDGQTESKFEASILKELCLLRMDLAFAKIWGLKLVEQQLTSKVIRLDRVLFGNSQLAEGVETEKPKKEKETVDLPENNQPKIEKKEEFKTIQPIAIKEEIPSDFGVLDKSIYNDQNPIPLDVPFPSGVIYKIQIGAFSTPRDPNFFKGMVPVSGERIGKIIKYFIGNLTHYSDAENALGVVKSKGFKDAFIIAWYNGKQVTPQRAQSLENSTQQVQKSSTVETGRIYIVQIGVYDGDLPDDVAKTVKALAPGKDITRNDDARGLKVYSVGNFSSFDEASRVKENMVASGIVNAVVVHIDLEKK